MSATADRITSAAAYTGSAITTVAGFTINEWAAIFGILLGAATFAYNVYHKRELRKIARERNGMVVVD